MQDFFITLILNLAVVSALLVPLKFLKLVEIDLRWAALSAVLFLLNYSSLFLGKHIIPLDLLFSELNWNWAGKITSIGMWILTLCAFIKLKPSFQPADAGFTLKQTTGSLKPAIVVTIGITIFQISFISIFGNSPEYDAEELLFQATMPGLDEEPWFRGILLYILSLALISARFNVMGTKINIAGLSLVFLFGLLHGLTYNEGEIAFSAFSAFITGFYGFVFLWLRERTGSLVFPLIAHNCINFFGQFFPLSLS